MSSIEAAIMQALADGPASRHAITQRLQGQHGIKRVQSVIAAMLRKGMVFESEKTSGGFLIGLAPFTPFRTILIEHLTQKPMSVRSLAKITNRGRTSVHDAINRLEQDGVVISTGDCPHERVWRLTPKAFERDEFCPSSSENLVIKMKAQWRGTPWQGLEVVL